LVGTCKPATERVPAVPPGWFDRHRAQHL